MKNKQKSFLKFVTLLAILCSTSILQAQIPASIMNKADSLFSHKQYTQSLELYQGILKQHQYSHSMLLKMAYIEEGLGHLSESLYYLNLYHTITGDKQAWIKINDLAAKHHLVGYQSNQSRMIHSFLRDYYITIAGVLASILVFLFALLIYQKKAKHNPMTTAIFMLIILLFFFLHTNFSEKTDMGIVHENGTYLMSGPSAGASVVSIIDEGHLLDVLGTEDVWIHIKWMSQDAYLKKDKVLMIDL